MARAVAASSEGISSVRIMDLSPPELPLPSVAVCCCTGAAARASNPPPTPSSYLNCQTASPTLPSLPPQFASGYCTVHSPHHCTTAPQHHTPHSRSQGLTSPPVDHSHAHAFVRTHFHCLWRCPRPKLAPWLLPHEQAQFSIVCRHHALPSFAERSGAHLGPLCSLWGMPAGSTPAAFYLLYPCTPRFLPLWFASRPGNTRRKPIFLF
jgi:hypothetical protein